MGADGPYFERGVAEVYPDLERVPIERGDTARARYRVTIRPERFESRRVAITIRKRGLPRVCVDGPSEGLPHRYRTAGSPCGPLCMWHPQDPPGQRWSKNDGLLALLGHIRTHLIREGFFLEDLRLTGNAEWLGPQAPHGSDSKNG